MQELFAKYEREWNEIRAYLIRKQLCLKSVSNDVKFIFKIYNLINLDTIK